MSILFGDGQTLKSAKANLKSKGSLCLKKSSFGETNTFKNDRNNIFQEFNRKDVQG